MKKILLNMIAIASTCCCLFKGAKNISNKKVLDNQNNTYLEAERLDAKFSVEKEIGKEIDRGIDLEPVKGVTDPSPYPEYINGGTGDDKMEGAQKIDPKWGKITGNIVTYNGWEQFWLNVGSIDQDWYTLQTVEHREYSITFDTPSLTNSYVLRIYKVRGTGTSNELRLIKEYKGDTVTTLTVNEVGTYYLQVTCTNKKDIAKNRNYEIIYNDIKTNEPFVLNEQNKATYKMALWENDYIPRNVNRWNNNDKQCIYNYHSDGTNQTVSGDDDYIFHSPNGERILDSVLYIWGNEEIDATLKLLKKIDQEVKRDFKNQQILDASVSVANDGIGLFLTIVGTLTEETYPFWESLSGAVGVIATVVCFANGLLNLIFPDDSASKLQSFIDILSSACYWVSTYHIENAVICIPRYTYYSFVTSNSGRTGGITEYWNFTYAVEDEMYKEFYDFTAESSITNYQTYNNGNKTFHGKITPFATGEDFLNFFGLDISDYIDLDSYIFAEEYYVTNEPLYEKQLSFDRYNDYTQYAKVKFQNSGSTLFFTRSSLNTRVELYDEYLSTRYASNRGDGYEGNGMFSYNVTANKSYIVKVSMIVPDGEIAMGWAALDIIQGVTYKNNYIFTSPQEYSDIAQIVGGPFEGFAEFATNRSTIMSFIPEQSGEYLISTHYTEDYHLIPISMGDFNSWECDHQYGTGTLNADYIHLDANVPCLIVVARNDRSVEVPSSGALHSFGMLICNRTIDDDTPNDDGWDCEGNTFYYVEPSKLTYHSGSTPYYEINEVIYTEVEPWHMESFRYLGLYDYTNANFFYQSVTPLNDGTSGVRIVFRTYNATAEGEMYIRYSWHHVSYEDPNL